MVCLDVSSKFIDEAPLRKSNEDSKYKMKGNSQVEIYRYFCDCAQISIQIHP